MGLMSAWCQNRTTCDGVTGVEMDLERRSENRGRRIWLK